MIIKLIDARGAIELTDDEFDTLIQTLGSAVGWMFLYGHRDSAFKVVALMNKIGKDRPDFSPYEVPPAQWVKQSRVKP
jgi:hypothetical protein